MKSSEAVAGLMAALALLTGCSAVDSAAEQPAGFSTGSSSTASVFSAPATARSSANTALAPLVGESGQLVLMGDSYAAGEGGGMYQLRRPTSGSLCHRSAYVVGASLFPAENVHNLACSRAATKHFTVPQNSDLQGGAVVAPQLEQLRGLHPSLVIVAVGGNDVGFAEIMRRCLLEHAECTSNTDLLDRTSRSLESLGSRLQSVYESVAERTDAPVLVLPYPQLFDEHDGGCGRLSESEVLYGRRLVTQLNAAAEQGVDRANLKNLHYVDAMAEALVGHGACGHHPAVHAANESGLISAALSVPVAQELLHPTREGYQLMTGALIEWSRNREI